MVPVFTSTKNANGSSSVNVSYDSQSADNFMVYDIAALQSMYGANTTTNTGNNTYYFDPADTARAAVYEEGAFYYTLPIYHSIWDAGGIDTLNFASTTHSNTIKLTSGSYSAVDYRSVATQIADQQAKYYTDLGTNYYDSWVASEYNKYLNKIYTGENALGIAYGSVIENAVGGSAADFYDNSVNNSLTGNAGDDLFYLGAGGFDTVTGGDGTDKLVLTITKASVQLEKQSTGETLVVASNFAVSLIGVESIQFSDQLYTLV
jgi:Ca2+-binding RTX toxin-like protein